LSSHEGAKGKVHCDWALTTTSASEPHRFSSSFWAPRAHSSMYEQAVDTLNWPFCFVFFFLDERSDVSVFILNDSYRDII
jgi:hypothetical protein